MFVYGTTTTTSSFNVFLLFSHLVIIWINEGNSTNEGKHSLTQAVNSGETHSNGHYKSGTKIVHHKKLKTPLHTVRAIWYKTWKEKWLTQSAPRPHGWREAMQNRTQGSQLSSPRMERGHAEKNPKVPTRRASLPQLGISRVKKPSNGTSTPKGLWNGRVAQDKTALTDNNQQSQAS